MEQIQKIPGLVFVKDLNLRYINVSPEFVRHSGLNNADDLVDLDDTHMPWVEYAEQYRNDDAHVIQFGRLQKIEPFMNFYGDHFYTMVTKEQFRNHGIIVGIIGNSHILSTQLQKQLKQLRALDKVISSEKTLKYTLQSCYKNLTKRESEIFFLMLRHFSAKMVAKKLEISHRTVEKHIEMIKHKLNLQSKNDIIEYAIQNHLIEIIITS